MFTFILRRLLYSIPVLVAASFLIFCAVSAIGDPFSELKQNPLVSQVTLESIARKKHLHDPIPERYIYWVKDAVTNQFGTPLLVNEPIWHDLRRVIPHTLQLVLSSELLALLIGVGIGVYSAIRQYSVFDYLATTFSFLGFAMPVFWLALMLQILFTNLFLSTHVRVFYTSGLSSVDAGHGFRFLLDRAQHLGIPVMVLAVLSIAQYSRYMRASMLEVVNSDYVRTARAKGAGERRVLYFHALRNAMIPVVTILALSFGGLFSGALITETMFAYPGMGKLIYDAVMGNDYNLALAGLLLATFVTLIANLGADLAYAALDPRIAYR
jgi:peptide/nickel transport system permease protein